MNVPLVLLGWFARRGSPSESGMDWFAAVVLAAVLTATGTLCRAEPPDGRREGWTESRIRGSPDSPAPYSTRPLLPRLRFREPVEIALVPGTDAFFLAELGGRIFTFPSTGDPDAAHLVWDGKAAVSRLEALYGLAFDPDFESNRFCYICYVLPTGLPDGSRVSRFRVSASDPPRIESETEEILICWYSGGHNGGCLRFGPDGYLYISTGDGTNAFPPDEFETGQDIDDLLSCILRIDVHQKSDGRAYSIPKDNPFVGVAGAREEIWCYGLRNPWKMSFDPRDGGLWVGDVGWELWELVYRAEKGGNYGWSVMEGRQRVHPGLARGPTPILPPTIDHPHTEAKSITGGLVYEGCRFPELRGTYIYGDWFSGKVWGLRHDGRRVIWHGELADTTHAIICFGVDAAGELCIVDYQGTLHALVPNMETAASVRFPRRLSETGLFRDLSSLTPAPGVSPYGICAEPWMDGLVAERHVGVPGDGRIDAENTPWVFPLDTVFAKTLSVPGAADSAPPVRRLETQILHFDGRRWNGYTYLWNEAQSDAELVDASGTQIKHEVSTADGRRGVRLHRLHSRTQCAVCHNEAAGPVLGFTVEQLAGQRADTVPASSALDRLRQQGLFSRSPPTPDRLFVSPHDATASLNDRARTYLHVNCAHCHRRHAGGTAHIEFPFALSLHQLRAVGQQPSQGTFDIPGAEIIAPGRPFQSVLLYRLLKMGQGRMPQLGAEMIDSEGALLIADWISSLHANPSRADRSDNPTPLPSIWSLANTSAALELAVALHRGDASPEARSPLLEAAANHSDPRIYGLFEHFLEPGQRASRLGDVIDLEALAATRGSASRGKELFWSSASLTCNACHRIAGRGGDVGPPLDALAERNSRRQVLESIVEPAKVIDPRFATYALETTDGRVVLGLMLEQSDRGIKLRTAQGQQVFIPASDIAELNVQPTSLMPETLLRDLTQQEAADLLEYLMSPED